MLINFLNNLDKIDTKKGKIFDVDQSLLMSSVIKKNSPFENTIILCNIHF